MGDFSHLAGPGPQRSPLPSWVGACPVLHPATHSRDHGGEPRCSSVYAESTPREHHVLCGVDLRPRDPGVVAVAGMLAERLDLELVVLHVAGHQFRVGHDRAQILERAREKVQRATSRQKVDEILIQLGDPASQLAATACDATHLLVIGSRGRGPVKAAMLGSVSNQLAKASPCPLIVVPQGSAGQFAGAVRRKPVVICGIDGSPEASVALEIACRLAAQLTGRVLVTHVERGPFEASVPSIAGVHPEQYEAVEVATRKSALQLLSRDIGDAAAVDWEVRLVRGEPSSALAAVAEEEDAALVVVGAQRGHTIQSVLLGSVSSRLAARAPVPICLVPTPVMPLARESCACTSHSRGDS